MSVAPNPKASVSLRQIGREGQQWLSIMLS
ncbi:hypothetical protein J2X24_003725 [Asticcacaulis solisilvae]|nr:hypothetical protein [Asticcacaulis solisilvae]MDR6802188.1 hypothetical protein [Asticcacaulis sp. BE141]